MSPNPSAAGAAGARPRYPRRVATGWAPLSVAQQRLWTFHQSQPLSALHNVARAFRICGPLDPGLLRKTLEAVVARHEILRTIYVSEQDQPIQVIRDDWTFELEQIDLGDLPPDRREIVAARLIGSEARRSFDLSADLVLRAALVCLAPEQHILLMAAHRIAADDRSMNILIAEASRLYETLQAGNAGTPPRPAVQYADYAAWQRKSLAAGAFQAQFAFWRERLSGMLPVRLPVRRARPAAALRSTRYGWTISRQTELSIARLCRSEEVEPFTVLFASFAALLSRYTGQDDIAIGSPSTLQVSGDPIVGHLTHTLVLRTSLAANPTFRTLLRRVHQTKREAEAHQELPLEAVMQEMAPEPSDGLHLPPVTFVHRVHAEAEFRIPGALVQTVAVDAEAALSDLRLSFAESAEGLSACFEFRPEALDAGFVQRMAGHFDQLLESALHDAGRRLSELKLLPEAELQQTVFEWNPASAYGCAEPPVTGTIEARAADSPESLAVDDGRSLLSYGELNRRANQVARFLGRIGVRRGAAVGLFAEHSADCLVGMLGILKAGCVCVPLDGGTASARLDFILRDAGIQCVLVSSDALVRHTIGNPDSALPGRKVVLIDSGWSQISDESPQNLPLDAHPAETAYIVYPPDSAGVAVPQAAVARHCRALIGHCSLSREDRVLLLAPDSVELRPEPALSALLCGCSLVLAGSVPENLAGSHITVAFVQLPAWGQFLDAVNGTAGSPIRLVIAGGQVSYPADAARAPLKRARLLSAWGRPETLATAAMFEVPHLESEAPDATPAGRPLASHVMYLLDRFMQPVPAGLPGELYVGGESIASGYLNAPETTALKFVPNPFGPAGSRLFRTGETARLRPDGNVELCRPAEPRVPA